MGRATILMATYNGAEYVREQIRSIQAQDEPDWELLIHDDGSTDNTVAIIDEIAAADPRVKRVLPDVLHLGSKAGFHRLLQEAEADYYFFCDQDDFWLPNKISLSLAAIENVHGPALVYTDLTIVDADLTEIAPSMHRASRYPDVQTYAQLLVQNSVTGNTVCMNAALKQLVVKQSIADAAMHDWWYALNAAARGQLVYLDQPTVLYRQHGHNVVGAEQSMLQRALHSDARQNSLRGFAQLQLQAQALIAAQVPQQSADQHATETVSQLLTAPRLKTIVRLARQGSVKSGLLKNLLFFVLILTRPRAPK